MKKSVIILSAILIPILVISAVYIYKTEAIKKLDFSILTIYSYSDIETLERSFPEDELKTVTVNNSNKVLIHPKDDGTYYALIDDKASKLLCQLDENINITGSLPVDAEAVNIYEYAGTPTLLCKNSKTVYSLISFDFSNNEQKLISDRIELGELPDSFYVKGKTIAYENSDGAINIKQNEEEIKIIGTKEESLYLLCLKNEESVLIFEKLSDFFRFGKILEYNINNNTFSTIRYATIPGTNYCDISSDGEYLISYRIIPWDSICEPVVFELDFPVSKKFKTQNSDFSFIKWQEH